MGGYELCQILSPEQVQIGAWFFFDGLTQDEIAEKTHQTQQAIAQKLEIIRRKVYTAFGHNLVRKRLANTRHTRTLSPSRFRRL